MNKHTLKPIVLLGSLFCLLFSACSDKEEIEPFFPFPHKPVTVEDKVNRFVAEQTYMYYLWTSTIDWNAMDPAKQGDPEEYFEKLIYKDDSWSFFTDDFKDLEGGFQGVSTTYGYNLAFAPISEDGDTLAGIVRFVYPNTPAAKAGLNRGDLLVYMNFGFITRDNYEDLFNSSSIMLGRARIVNDTLQVDSMQIYMAAESMYEDPIIKDTILQKGAHKIGYLCYSDFVDKSEPYLLDVFAGFKAGGVTDVVLDLRYNSGGHASTANLIASVLAPQAVVQQKEVFMKQYWNDFMMQVWKEAGKEVDVLLTDTLPVNLNLNRVYILALSGSASASEATIIGLNPYMEVIHIGDTTHGKYCGGNLFSGELWDDQKEDFVVDKEIENWGMYLMTFRYANKNGISSFTGGLVPDVYLPEDDIADFYPFGDERDPMLGKAIEMITGTTVQPRSGRLQSRYRIEPSILQSRPLDGKLIDTRPLIGRKVNF